MAPISEAGNFKIARLWFALAAIFAVVVLYVIHQVTVGGDGPIFAAVVGITSSITAGTLGFSIGRSR